MRDPAPQLAHVHLHGARVVEAERPGEVSPRLRTDPVGGPSGRLVEQVAHIEQRLSGSLEVGVRHVHQPRRHQGLEHRGVAQSTLGLLEVGHREVRQLADPVVPGAHQLAQGGESLRRVPPPRRQHGGPQPQGEVGIAREVAYVEQPQRDPQVVLRRRRHLRRGPHGVVEAHPGVPQRIPDLLGQVAGLDVVVVDQHQVQVGVRRQLAATEAADGDEGHPVVGATGDVVRRHADGVRGLGPARALSCGHDAAEPRSPACTRPSLSRASGPLSRAPGPLSRARGRVRVALRRDSTDRRRDSTDGRRDSTDRRRVSTSDPLTTAVTSFIGPPDDMSVPGRDGARPGTRGMCCARARSRLRRGRRCGPERRSPPG